MPRNDLRDGTKRQNVTADDLPGQGRRDDHGVAARQTNPLGQEDGDDRLSTAEGDELPGQRSGDLLNSCARRPTLPGLAGGDDHGPPAGEDEMPSQIGRDDQDAAARQPIPSGQRGCVAQNPRAGRDVLSRIYPETPAGGYNRANSRVRFYTRVRSLLHPRQQVLDLGAGAGTWFHRLPRWQAALCDLRGAGRVVHGCDVDHAVLTNPALNFRNVVKPGQPLPYVDETIDLIVAYAVLEHVADPEALAGEVRRVLKPGSWFCAWTPHKFGFVGLGAQLVPSRLHAKLLPRVSPHDQRAETDVFPTAYRMNTRRALQRLFPDWLDATHNLPGPPAYNLGSVAIARAIQGWEAVAPVKAELHVFVRKP